MPRYRRHYQQGHTVFVTVVTQARQPWLADAAAVEVLLGAMRRVKSLYAFQHRAHVVMPDHFHWMFDPAGADFSAIVGAVKREVSWRVRWDASGRHSRPAASRLWQPRFYDHLIRDEADFFRHLDYLHFNPVHHGITASPASYPHSSFAAWAERGVYDRNWGQQIPDTIQNMTLE
ncbi:MAG: uncharacterized protein JWQ90_417 [Hydrocarboniphaga sp.]|uniref:REP-associated tyrosine transposase n=1 Tax=Hydrocarboniphaga sp. TaxID=2033016 RepID=UPI00262A3F7F|nr:transposase [Hydrocarboniphaga sp.]MDB5967967.1 uncharacterized protein [Hydrocarboniphaga sp.]